jgi:hypothetical protein
MEHKRIVRVRAVADANNMFRGGQVWLSEGTIAARFRSIHVAE